MQFVLLVKCKKRILFSPLFLFHNQFINTEGFFPWLCPSPFETYSQRIGNSFAHGSHTHFLSVSALVPCLTSSLLKAEVSHRSSFGEDLNKHVFLSALNWSFPKKPLWLQAVFTVLPSQLILRSIQETTIIKKKIHLKQWLLPALQWALGKPFLCCLLLLWDMWADRALWLLQISAELLRPPNFTAEKPPQQLDEEWDGIAEGMEWEGSPCAGAVWVCRPLRDHQLNYRVLTEGCNYALSCIASLWGCYINILWPEEFRVDAGILGGEESCAALAVSSVGIWGLQGYLLISVSVSLPAALSCPCLWRRWVLCFLL